MSTWKPSQVRASFRRRCRGALRRLLPGAVWLCTIGVVIWLGTHLPGLSVLVGVVDAAHGAVTSQVGGRVTAVLVTLHQEVEPDQVVVRLDDSEVRLRLTQATYELERLRADMLREAADLAQQASSAKAEHGLDAGVEQRRLIRDVEAAQLAALSTRTRLEEARVRVEAAVIEKDRVGLLAKEGFVAAAELVRVRTECAAQQTRISELTALHQEQTLRVATAEQRWRDFAPAAPSLLSAETALAPMRWRLKVQESVLDRIAEDAKQLVLKAPIRGRVAQVSIEVGEWAAAGRPLAAIVDATPRRILAYVPELVRGQLDAAQSVRVLRQDNAVLGTTTIQSISPSVVCVPARLWRDAQQEEWAYEIVVAATGQERAGERVQIALCR